MGSPTIFSGSRTKLLTSKGLLFQDGTTIDYDGPKNYITNFNAESGATTGWATYADAAAVPVDATGGSPTATWTVTGTSPQRGTYSFLFTSGTLGDGVSWDFTLDNADVNKALYLSFDISATTYTSGDLKFYLYDVTNTSMSELKGSIVNGRGTYRGYASDSTSYRVAIHQVTANSFTAKFDNFSFGPDKLVDAPVVSEAVSYTPTISNFSTAGATGKYSRVGNRAIIEIYAEANGAASGTIEVPLPSGLTIDTTQLPNAVDTATVLGVASAVDSGVGYHLGHVVYRNTTTVRIQDDDGSGAWAAAVPMTWASTDKLSIKFEVPISEWANSSAVLSTTEMMNQTIKAKMNLSGAQSIASGSFVKIGVDTVAIDTANIADGASSSITANKSGYYFVSANVGFATNSTGDRGVAIALNGSVVGASIVKAADSFDTTVNVNTLLYMDPGDYIELQAIQGSGGNLNVQSATNNTWIEVIESPDFSVYSVFGENEQVESASGAFTAWPITVDQYGDLTSITLTAGEWDLSCLVQSYNNGAVTTADINIAMTTTSGNSTAGFEYGNNVASLVPSTTTGLYNSASIPAYRVVLTSTTTYYLKARATLSITNLEANWRISARRIA